LRTLAFSKTTYYYHGLLDHEGVKQDRTVLVRGDRIVSIGSRYEVKVPSDAVVIDGAGQYLVPGLTDVHVHLTGTPVMRTRDDFGDAPVYLAYGVTTVMNLGGSPTVLEWRKRVNAGTLLGPAIYTAGPFVNEPRVNTPDEVERVTQAELGYDLIKFHEFPGTTTGLSLPAYRSMLETARRIGIPLVGHAPVNLGIDEMLRERQSIAHMGMMANLYFLPFSSHTTLLLVTAIASLILICMALTSVGAAIVRRFSKKVLRRPSAPGTMRKLTGMIALATACAFICVFAYLPGGPLFDSVFLRLAFTGLTGIVTAATLTAGFFAVRLLRDVAAPTLGKVQALLAVINAVALTAVMLGFGLPFHGGVQTAGSTAWRSGSMTRGYSSSPRWLSTTPSAPADGQCSLTTPSFGSSCPQFAKPGGKSRSGAYHSIGSRGSTRRLPARCTATACPSWLAQTQWDCH
jgi:dolichol kinase